LEESSFTVHDLPKPERPRERLKQFGPEALSAQELLALIIGRGVSKKSVMTIAQELLIKFGNIKAISEATLEELSQIKSIGFAKAAQIKACFELGKRQDLEPEQKDSDIKDPQSVVKAIRASIKDKAKEHFKLILLNARNKILGISTISIGSLNAYSVVLAHNHPSGDSEPSEDDFTMTKRLITKLLT
jgi:DNA repair protein RadC